MCVPEEIVENFNVIKAIYEETDTSNRWQLVPAKVPNGRLITSWHPVCHCKDWLRIDLEQCLFWCLHINVFQLRLPVELLRGV